MKKFDIVKLKHITKEYAMYGLYEGIHGVVLEPDSKESKVIFISDYDLEESTYITVYNNHLEVEKEKLPQSIIEEIQKNLKRLQCQDNKKLQDREFFENDVVELIKDDEKYKTHGVTKGMIGIVAYPYSINHEYLVDFSTVLEDESVVGDCISVHASDIKKIEK